MSDVIFVRTHTPYDSHSDLYALAALSGYRVCYVADVDPYDASKTYIFGKINSEWQGGYPDAKARLIWYDFEWDDTQPLPVGFAEKWHMDYTLAKRSGWRYVPVGSHPLLKSGLVVAAEPKYDFIMLAHFTHRREVIRDQLLRQGLTIAPQGWGRQRHEALSRSKVMLHVHQHHQYKGIPGLRWAIAAAYHLPVVSEMVDDGGILNGLTSAQYEYGQLAEGLLQRLNDDTLYRYAEELYYRLCEEYTFRKLIEASL